MLYLEALELAEEAVQAKQFEISVHYLKEAVELRPQDAQPHLRLAEIYDQNGDSNGAAAERRTAEELSQRISHP